MAMSKAYSITAITHKETGQTDVGTARMAELANERYCKMLVENSRGKTAAKRRVFA